MNTITTPSTADLREMAKAASNLAKTIQTESKIHPFTGHQSKQVEEIAKALPWEWAYNLEANCGVNDFVEDMLTNEGLSVVYGQSGSGKSFVVLRIAAAVAAGTKFYDKECDKGAVIYLAAEGAVGVKNRMFALKKEGLIKEGSRLVYVPCCINVLDKEQVTSLIATAVEAAAGLDVPVRLIILDTLSQCMPGSNENSPEDMTAVVEAANGIRKITGANVLFVHHSGKNQAAGSRGHSSLRAATDTEIEITREEGEEIGQITCKKAKDLAPFRSMGFKLRVVVLGKNRRGKDVTTCVLDEVAHEDLPVKRTAIDGAISIILQALATSSNGLNKTEIRALKGAGSSTKDAAIKSMTDCGTIIKTECANETRYRLPQHPKPAQLDPADYKPTKKNLIGPKEPKTNTMTNPERGKV